MGESLAFGVGSVKVHPDRLAPREGEVNWTIAAPINAAQLFT